MPGTSICLEPKVLLSRLQVIAWLCKRLKPGSIRALNVTLKLERPFVVVKAACGNFSRSFPANFSNPFNITHNLSSSGFCSPTTHSTPSSSPAAAPDRVPWRKAISPHFLSRSQYVFGAPRLPRPRLYHRRCRPPPRSLLPLRSSSAEPTSSSRVPPLQRPRAQTNLLAGFWLCPPRYSSQYSNTYWRRRTGYRQV